MDLILKLLLTCIKAEVTFFRQEKPPRKIQFSKDVTP